MFSSVRDNKRLVQGFLVLITLPFALWGVESYVRNSRVGDDVATVGSAKISQQELRAALNEQQERLREQAEGQFDPAVFDTPQVRRMVLDSLITKRLLFQHAHDSRLVVNDGELANRIASIPAFQENGHFSKTQYASVLQAQGMQQELFEARLRQDMTTQQLIFPVVAGSIPGHTSANRWLMAQMEQREVAETHLKASDYASKVVLPADAAKKYYDANLKKFEVPAQVRAEYVVLNRDALASQVTVSEAEIKAAYDARIDRYKEGERRRASHILITVAKDASPADIQKARATAEDILAKVKQAPSDFAQLAKQYSQDPASAAQGGDLGWFGRGMMVKPFEDAAFQLQEGQTSGIIRSDFGFHIIHVTGVQPEKIKTLAEVHDAIANDLKQEAGAKKYAEAAEAFGNMVYEQGDSLSPVVEKWKLSLQQSGWLSKGGKLPPPFDNAKLAAALFSDDVLKAKHNTEAVETAPGNLVAARVVESKPASTQPFEAVKADIEKHLTQEAAMQLAMKDGEAKLAQLVKGGVVDLKWSSPHLVNRMATHDVPALSIQAIFSAKTAHLPAYTGTRFLDEGYVIYRIDSVKPFESSKQDAMAKALEERYRQIVAEEEAMAWLARLKADISVKINDAALEKH